MAGLRMAKATETDMKLVRKFLQYVEYVSKTNVTKQGLVDDWGEDSDYYTDLSTCFEDGQFEHEYFVEMVETAIGHRWERIVFGYEVLFENTCDPKKTYLDFKPELKNVLSLPEVKELCEEIHNKKGEIDDFSVFWADKEKELLEQKE